MMRRRRINDDNTAENRAFEVSPCNEDGRTATVDEAEQALRKRKEMQRLHGPPQEQALLLSSGGRGYAFRQRDARNAPRLRHDDFERDLQTRSLTARSFRPLTFPLHLSSAGVF